MKKRKIGLALSGGAVLGIAHLGVIKVLEQYAVPIHCIAGTSVGALIGAFLAAGFRYEQMVPIAGKLSWGRISKMALSRTGIFNSRALEHFIEQHLGKLQIEELERPFAAVAVDIVSGKEACLQGGGCPGSCPWLGSDPPGYQAFQHPFHP